MHVGRSTSRAEKGIPADLAKALRVVGPASLVLWPVEPEWTEASVVGGTRLRREPYAAAPLALLLCFI